MIDVLPSFSYFSLCFLCLSSSGNGITFSLTLACCPQKGLPKTPENPSISLQWPERIPLVFSLSSPQALPALFSFHPLQLSLLCFPFTPSSSPPLSYAPPAEKAPPHCSCSWPAPLTVCSFLQILWTRVDLWLVPQQPTRD